MICLTGGTDSDIVEWKEISMANYPVYKMDDTTLKTIARGNPAFVRLKDGMILWKSALDSITVDDITSQDNVAGNGMGLLFWLTSIFILLMVLLLIVNRTPLLIKFTVRLKKNRKKK